MSADLINESHAKQDHLNANSKVEVMVLAKSDKTLTKNIDSKDDSLRKRTSLIIVPQKDSPTDLHEQTIGHNMSSSTIDTENCNELITDAKQAMTKSFDSSICSNHSSADEEDLNDHKTKPMDLHQKKLSNRTSLASVDSCVSRSNTSSSSSSSESTSSGDDVALDDYHDLENGNIIDDLDADRKNCISNSSSCIDDYSLREKLHNYVNAKQDNGGEGRSSTDVDEGNIEGDDVDSQPCSLPMQCDALLSPQEAPMGRRYAEVSQFKGNKR